jgi:aromatic-L-amino-acid/L-tryptophan decarboxylase
MSKPLLTESLEESLDPAGPAEWSEFRALAHRMVDDMLDHLSTIRDQPVWRSPPPEVRSALSSSLPLEGEGEEAAYQSFLRLVLPYPNGNLHPRFWGWVQGNGTPFGMMADMLAAGLNPHLAGFDQSPTLVEHQVVRWLAELMGFPADASGLMVTGGSMANILGLAVARHHALERIGINVREDGLQDAPTGRTTPKLICYGSTEVHGWAQKALELLGLGKGSLRLIPVDEEYRMNVPLLKEAVARDWAAGALPCCVIGTAGTVNTGATDVLASLAQFCRDEKIWFHVDGAFGALLRLSPKLRDRVDGIELADSLGFDLHKWGYLPFECACLLVRNPELHRATFAISASYLGGAKRGAIAGGFSFADRGVDLTRGFKALKVWLSFKAYGVKALARLIEQNVAQAQYLANLIDAHPELELLAPVPLNVVCFRFMPRGNEGADLNALNEEILLRVQEGGLALPSATVLQGRYAIRCANVNHRSRRTDFELLVDEVVKLGRKISAGD